ncbi:vWA domain-containing protein [Psychrobacter sp. I-STPA10]|uniref:vWA domain-containing protein n=1 Tax=Psychrobacter sp. I-STPA10 TaxID=2585769 RepID=UPI001E65011D|nr:VWA domain-containing protein [Psychrobacter sp. I-STPA10]
MDTTITTRLSKSTLSVSIASLLLLTACSQKVENMPQTPPSNEMVAPASAPEPVVVADTSAKEVAATASPVIVVENEANISPAYLTRAATVAPISPPDSVSYQQNTENYQKITANAVHKTSEDAIATLSIDTDTGSYANVRRFINQGRLPPSDAVRVEELINYFHYDFGHATKKSGVPFLVDTQVVQSPWQSTNRIVKIGIQANDTATEQAIKGQALPPANLVFLVDVSGSMSSPNKLELAKSSLKMLTKQLRKQDTITLITYAGNTEVVLPATSGDKTQTILNAIDKLDAGGSTNGEAAIKLAYEQAQASLKPNGINRILMLTDGDFNVGVSSVDEMLDIIRKNRDNGISLSTLGFGQGNYNDYMMEQVADNGNGNYSYIDSLSEAKKVLIDEMSATFNTVAKDVKVQVEFNPAVVSEWRLIGYENRVLATEDFNNDKVDAAELGAGKSVVALFEVTPVGAQGLLDDSRYQKTPSATTKTNNDKTNELAFLKIRYKAPNGDTSKLVTYPIANQLSTANSDTKFAMAVAGYGQLLSDSKYINNWTYADSKRLAQQGIGTDSTGSRGEFIQLVELADALQ